MRSIFRKSFRGSYTIEASIVFVFIFAILITFIFSSMLLCQKVMLLSISNKAVSKAEQAMKIRILNSEGLYDALRVNSIVFEEHMDLSSNMYDKIDELKASQMTEGIDDYTIRVVRQCLYSELSRTVIRNGQVKIKIHLSNSLAGRRIEIKIEQEIAIPLSFIKAWISGKSTMTLKSDAASALSSTSDYIRNMDLIIEYIERIKEGIDSKGLSEVERK